MLRIAALDFALKPLSFQFLGLWKWNVKSATISGMKILLFPLVVAGSALSVALLQIEQIDVSFLTRLVTELPVTIAVVWLIIKLDDRHRQTMRRMMQSFMDMHIKTVEQHRQDKDQLLEIIAHLRIDK